MSLKLLAVTNAGSYLAKTSPLGVLPNQGAEVSPLRPRAGVRVIDTLEVKQDGTKDYTTIDAALAAASTLQTNTMAAEGSLLKTPNHYVEILVHPGTYTITTQLTPASFTAIIAQSATPGSVVIRSLDLTSGALGTFLTNGDIYFEGLDIVRAGPTAANSGKYCIHMGMNSYATATFVRCRFFTETAHSVGGYTCVGMDGAPGIGVLFHECEFWSGSGATVRTNAFRNPSLTTNATDWSNAVGTSGTATGTRVSGAALTIPETGQVINWFYRQQWTTVSTGVLTSTGVLVGSSATDAIVLTPGVAQRVHVYARSSVAGRQCTMTVTSHTSAGANQVIESSNTNVTIGGTGWTRMSSNVFTPAAGQVRGFFRVYNVAGTGTTTSHVVGDTLDVTAVLVETASTVGAFFDGDTPTSIGTGKRRTWLGTAGASQSTERSYTAGGTNLHGLIGGAPSGSLVSDVIFRRCLGGAVGYDALTNVVPDDIWVDGGACTSVTGVGSLVELHYGNSPTGTLSAPGGVVANLTGVPAIAGGMTPLERLHYWGTAV